MLEVLYEDNHLIAINKKSGDIVQGDKTGDAPLSDFVKAYIKKKYNKRFRRHQKEELRKGDNG